MGNKTSLGAQWTIHNFTNDEFTLIDSNKSFAYQSFDFPIKMQPKSQYTFHSEVLTKYEELLGPQRNLSYCQWIY